MLDGRGGVGWGHERERGERGEKKKGEINLGGCFLDKIERHNYVKPFGKEDMIF